MVLCPECETNLDVEEEEVDEGEVISCPDAAPTSKSSPPVRSN